MPRKPRADPPEAQPTTSAGPEKAGPYLLRLYLARPTPSSNRAEANLVALLATMSGGGAAFKVEFVDVVKSPHQAVKDRIIVTPCLVVAGTNPPKTLVGDLRDAQVLLNFLERAVAAPS